MAVFSNNDTTFSVDMESYLRPNDTHIPHRGSSSLFGYGSGYDGDHMTTSRYDVTSNVTGSALESENDVEDWVRDVALGIVLSGLSVLTFAGNALVLHAVRTERRLQTVSNMFIVSLAIADLIVGLIVMPISAIYIFTVEWLFGVVVCQFWIGVDYTASTASILNLFILSLDRYWSVTSPLRYLRQRTKRRALVMISIVWFVSSLWLVPIIGWHYFEHSGERTVPSSVCDTEYATNTALKIVTGLLNFYLPLAVMYSLYGKIFGEIKRRSKLELGQQMAGGGGCGRPVATGRHTTRPPYIPASLSDDDPDDVSDDKMADAIPLRHSNNGQQRQLQTSLSRRSGDGDTDTDMTDDDIARLHKAGYTNLTLVRVAAENAARGYLGSPCSSDSDCPRSHYVYDESVLESTTEKVHRYYYQQLPQLTSGLHNGKPEPDVDGDASCGNGRVRFRIDQYNRDKRPLPLPKETHPAKNTYIVKPRCYRGTHSSGGGGASSTDDNGGSHSNGTGNETSPSHKLSPQCSLTNTSSKSLGGVVSGNHVNHNHNHNNHRTSRPHHHHRAQTPKDSALVQQALRWRLKLDKTKHKPSSALCKEIKAARQLGVIMGAFTVCFLPYFVCFMVVAFCDNCVPPRLMTAVTWIGYLNSTLNPFLYPMCNATFRRKFREMLHLSGGQDRRRSSVFYTPTRHMSMAGGGYDI